jgi:hypothetical protein
VQTRARAITGTASSGPRFFGPRSGGEPAVSPEVANVSSTAPNGRSLVQTARLKSRAAIVAVRLTGPPKLAEPL